MFYRWIHWDWAQPLIFMVALGFEGGESKKKGELNPANIRMICAMYGVEALWFFPLSLAFLLVLSLFSSS